MKTTEELLVDAIERADALLHEPATYQPETRHKELVKSILALYERAKLGD